MKSNPRTNARTTHARATAIGLATAATATALLAAPAAHAWVKDEACDEPVFGYKVCISAEEEKQDDGKVRVRNIKISSPAQAPGLRVEWTPRAKEGFSKLVVGFPGQFRLGSGGTENHCWSGWTGTSVRTTASGDWLFTENLCGTWPNDDGRLEVELFSVNSAGSRVTPYIDIDGK